MHIAFLTPEYPHHKVSHTAGIGTSIKNLVTALANVDIKVTVFVYGQKTQEIIIENSVNIHLIKNKRFKFLGWYFYRKSIENYCNSIISKEKIDIIEGPDWIGITAFMTFKIPLVIRFHGSDAYFCHLENRKQKRKNFWFEKLATKRAKGFIAPTKFAGELSAELFTIKNKEIITIHNGLDLENFENEIPKEFEKNRILYIGTLIRKKGVLEIPEIFKKVKNVVPDAKLVLVGGDSYDLRTGSKSTWKLMKDLFKDDLNSVDYLGEIPYNEIHNCIKKANVCVYPTFAETFGMVTIESMAMKKAVVNSNIGWAQELIVDQESGFLVHPSDHEIYADRIIQLLQNDLLCQEIGKKARERVEAKFDINILVYENIKFYQKVISQNKVQ